VIPLLLGLWLAGVGFALMLADGILGLIRWMRHRDIARARLERRGK
jgi:hypothetical protein